MKRSVKVKVIHETQSIVKIKLLTANCSVPIPRSDFEERVSKGLYEVVNNKN